MNENEKKKRKKVTKRKIKKNLAELKTRKGGQLGQIWGLGEVENPKGRPMQKRAGLAGEFCEPKNEER